ncbi:MAG: 23S rRNA (adenine(2503)-C(2))-methyltransferase RlmN [Nitrospiria bacterium]
MKKQNLKALNIEELERFVEGVGWPRYRADQILHWIYRKGVTQLEGMTDLSLLDRRILEERAYISQLKIMNAQASADGTFKFLLMLEDANTIESVLIPDDPLSTSSALGGRSGRRLTLCISTQVGCTLDCSFCLTGRMGLRRNLTAHEIVDQILSAQSYVGARADETKQSPPMPPHPALGLAEPDPRFSNVEARGGGQRITNIVLMGMGEPLANFHQVVEAIHRIGSPRGIGFPQRRITLSTAGLVPQIKTLGTLGLKINLAISLNATTDETRDQIMGTINRKYPIKELIRACREYPLPPRRRITFEYVLIKGVNDSILDAQRVVKLLKGIRCKVNLIPYNEHPGANFQRPTDQAVLQFQQVLMDAHLNAFIRKSKGQDILAACGQLATSTNTRRESRLSSLSSAS